MKDGVYEVFGEIPKCHICGKEPGEMKLLKRMSVKEPGADKQITVGYFCQGCLKNKGFELEKRIDDAVFFFRNPHGKYKGVPIHGMDKGELLEVIDFLILQLPNNRRI